MSSSSSNNPNGLSHAQIAQISQMIYNRILNVLVELLNTSNDQNINNHIVHDNEVIDQAEVPNDQGLGMEIESDDDDNEIVDMQSEDLNDQDFAGDIDHYMVYDDDIVDTQSEDLSEKDLAGDVDYNG